MSRLTQRKASGAWQVQGIAWEDLRKGEVLTEEMGQCLYGCLCKLKDYEDIGMSPDQLSRWWYELEDMIGHVCDNLCYHRREAKVQEELDEICADCPVSACMTRLLGLTEK